MRLFPAGSGSGGRDTRGPGAEGSKTVKAVPGGPGYFERPASSDSMSRQDNPSSTARRLTK